MQSLNSLNRLNTDPKPNMVDKIYYLFWTKGIDFIRFNELPIPYIMSIIYTHVDKQKEEEKMLKKNRKKGSL